MFYVLLPNLFAANSNALLPKKITQKCNVISIYFFYNVDLSFGLVSIYPCHIFCPNKHYPHTPSTSAFTHYIAITCSSDSR